ncbi:MAG: hypothetical protein M1831_000445 [Alyxoria varia]|nr:MAG: hypothetical protein M1831_000445 [Alyxoria varia]
MDHGHHSGGDSMEEPMCKMSMLFNWDPTDLCIIFSSWHIRSTLSLVLSLIAIALLTAGYEAVREVSRRYEQRVAMFGGGERGTPERAYSRSRSSGQRGYGNENAGEFGISSFASLRNRLFDVFLRRYRRSNWGLE